VKLNMPAIGMAARSSACGAPMSGFRIITMGDFDAMPRTPRIGAYVDRRSATV